MSASAFATDLERTVAWMSVMLTPRTPRSLRIPRGDVTIAEDRCQAVADGRRFRFRPFDSFGPAGIVCQARWVGDYLSPPTQRASAMRQ
jgi:hypothetical protein